MAAGYLNALSAYNGMQRGNNVLNSISNPQVVNPGQAIASAMQTAALAKYLRGGTVPSQSVRGIVQPGAISALTPNVSNASTAGTTTAAPATSAAAPAAAAPASTSAANASPGWFMPRTTAANQGNSVYSGGRYVDTSPGTLPYSGWQQGQGASSTGNATANPMSGPSGPNAAYTSLASSILSDPSDASVHSAFGDFRSSGFGVYSDTLHSQVIGMTPAQRLTWAHQLMQPQSSGTTYSPTVSVPSDASSQVGNALTQFSAQTGSGLNVSQ